MVRSSAALLRAPVLPASQCVSLTVMRFRIAGSLCFGIASDRARTQSTVTYLPRSLALPVLPRIPTIAPIYSRLLAKAPPPPSRPMATHRAVHRTIPARRAARWASPPRLWPRVAARPPLWFRGIVARPHHSGQCLVQPSKASRSRWMSIMAPSNPLFSM